jgi:predicted deacylase
MGLSEGKTMSLKSDFRWLHVSAMPDGSDLRLPLHIVKGARPGPTLGLSGALHGNEMVPSVSIIRHVLELLDPNELSGTVIALPICNPLGAGQESRNTPGDGMNLNGAFESGHGSIEPVKAVTEQIADVITNEFLSKLNYHIDFHTGGGNHSVHMIEFVNEPESTAMARAFNMPILLMDVWRPGQMWAMSEKLGVKVIVAECGGNALCDEWLERGVQGAFNVMRQLRMLPGEVIRPPRQYVVNNTTGHEHNLTILRPQEGGLIIPEPGIDARVSFVGQPVEGPRVLGKLLNMYDLSFRQEFATPFKRTLLLAAVVAPSWNYPGSFAYILANADDAQVRE